MEKTFLQQVGDRVHAGRICRDLSRKLLAERTGVHVATVPRMERGMEPVNKINRLL